MKYGISRASSVVLPAPLHPATPITFMPFSAFKFKPDRNIVDRAYIRLARHVIFSRHETDSQSPRPPDCAQSSGSAADRARLGLRPIRRTGRDQRPG